MIAMTLEICCDVCGEVERTDIEDGDYVGLDCFVGNWTEIDDETLCEDCAKEANDSPCPGCGCCPGDGPTDGCAHPEGCGFETVAHSDRVVYPDYQTNYRIGIPLLLLRCDCGMTFEDRTVAPQLDCYRCGRSVIGVVNALVVVRK